MLKLKIVIAPIYNYSTASTFMLIKIVFLFYLVMLSGCGSGDNSQVSITSYSMPQQMTGILLSEKSAANNIVPVSVGSFDSTDGYNTIFVTITVCVPGTTTCQQIDKVELDSGSTGLWLVSRNTGGELDSTVVPLPHAQYDGKNLYDCNSYGSFATAGGLYFADIYMNSYHFAKNVTVGVSGDVESHSSQLCLNNKSVSLPIGDYAINPPPTEVSIEANGILGVAGGYPLYVNDSATQACDKAFVCSSYAWNDGFSGPQNVLSMLNADGNGYTLSLPMPQPTSSESTDNSGVQGALLLGVNTQVNNMVNLSHVLYLRKSQVSSLTGFIGNSTVPVTVAFDTGTPVYFIGQGLLSEIGIDSKLSNSFIMNFFSISNSVSMNIDVHGVDEHNNPYNLDMPITDSGTIFSSYSGNVYPNLGGTFNDNGGVTSSVMIFGVPFFFGKNITFAFDGATIPNSSIVGSTMFIN